MPKATEITVSYERKFSDGNYGSEGMALTATVTVDQSEADLAVSNWRAWLRSRVLQALSESESPRVAAAANYELSPPPPRQPVAAGAPDDMEDLPL